MGSSYSKTLEDEFKEFDKKLEHSSCPAIQYQIEALKFLETVPKEYPCEGRVTSRFGWRRNPFRSGKVSLDNRRYEKHEGFDIANKTGTILYSTIDGIVVFSGIKRGYGKCIVITEKKRGYYSILYGHLRKRYVMEGDEIKKGQEIGEMGSTGRSTGPHVHYEIRAGSKPIDPERIWQYNKMLNLIR